MVGARRRDPGSRSSDGGNPVPLSPPSRRQAAIAAGVLASAGLVALSSAAATGVYTFLFIALTFAAAFGYALRGGPRAIRILLIAVIALAPLRGALLALADAIDLPDALLTVQRHPTVADRRVRRRGAPGPSLDVPGSAAASDRVLDGDRGRRPARLRDPDAWG